MLGGSESWSMEASNSALSGVAPRKKNNFQRDVTNYLNALSEEVLFKSSWQTAAMPKTEDHQRFKIETLHHLIFV